MPAVKTKPFRSTHNLPFEVGGPFKHDPAFIHFRVGTVTGLYATIGKSYCILALINHEKGNGHFTDTLEWFENSAKRDGYALRIIEIMNGRLMEHLINKRGFRKVDVDVVEKRF